MNSIFEIIMDTASKYPDRLCVVDDSGKYNYKEMVERVFLVAANLRKEGVQAKDCVMAECNQNVDYLTVCFGCNILGAYFVPVENKASKDRVHDIEVDTEAKLMVCTSSYDMSCAKVSYEDLLKENADKVELRTPDSDEIAEILYTTGTTGKSKGIAISYKNNIALAENIAYGTEMKEGNVELIPLPLSHSHGLRCAYANFFRGGAIVLVDGVAQVKKIYDLVKDNKVTAMDLSPTAVSVLIRMSRGKFKDFADQLDYIQVGTAALSEDVKELMKNEFPGQRLYNFYGSTESGRSCALNFNSSDDRKNCIGRPTKNARFIVVDDDRNEIKSSRENTGLLASAGAMNMKCYWKQPELTEATVVNGFIYTNDEAYIDEDGLVYVLGRKDDIINYQGIKIAPEEIEDVATKYDGVNDSACIALPDKVAGQVPKLFIEVENQDDFDMKAFQEYMKEHIDPNKFPKKFEIIDKIPRTYNGKLQRKVLRGQ